MERKAPPIVEQNQIGCVWKFSGMFDFDHHLHHHRHGRSRRKLMSDESHRSKSVSGPERSQVQMLTFDEQLKSINIESKKETASVNRVDHSGEDDEVFKNTMEKSFWKKITSRYENPNKKKENTKIVDTIVVLRPTRRVVESAVDLGCHCSYLHSRHGSTSKQQIVKSAPPVSFNDVRKKLKNSKKLKSIQKMKSSGELDGNGSKILKQREPEVFVEAKRHLAERLRLMAHGAGLGEPSGSSSKRVSRTLERVLLSSPKHESMASFGREPEGTHSARSLQKTLSGSSRLNLDSNPQNGSIERSQLEFSLDVSSPKADGKSENMDHDRFRENPSPVSVLESFFSDNTCSPTSTVESVELQMQPHRLDFEEHSSQTSSPPRHTGLVSFAYDRGFISSYVSDIYQVSQSNWDDFLANDYPLEPSCDHNKLLLLHDCVKEVLVSVHSRTTFISSKIQPFSLEKDVVNEVIERVDWHNGQPAGPRTLDHVVKRDIMKCGQWIDTVSDENDIVFEVVDETLQELIMEAVLTFGFTC
ncbi:hypothetical protein HanRHA438_Chr13g0587491 [Helianthus annuus]|uniref:DUF4378 domain-containing protein n=1 Tax=Helianthus annuus TaxID=4232 RepID=A0A251SPG5_HELAN|nr:uncharacterized protein LOC110897877 [Helianthus annuus]KAF5772424.1 hypothetical protein HanXRQr2_Chr13g0576701 [Helianthus annuus]KAJ0476033.1 hypothetical protein HanHA300_Chr13g0472501 [Helianthus annuus]KAJ0480099.1 hypothetical protein HanIR_Chr13g0627611 [Helianthus annuus]KAJ0496848.1 hypothetical protein HanHA89_Chr13g0504521 [Helianthus annuus]KAJ0662877.1 hypothetical protein HanLR1_Chr13g0474641 [Helianthus annuus]